VLPLEGFHLSRSLIKAMRKSDFEARINTAFDAVVAGCAERAETWINPEIAELYGVLHHRGHAHSQEIWEGDTLVGGVYGVVLGGAFFGESMFSRRDNASKMALACLVDRLRRAGFALFDTQFLTEHLASLGAVEITRAAYHHQLERAIKLPASFTAADPAPFQDVIQRMTQIS
jgi:leucyl/phenylalanyl-tRNA--protein transferase